jgi:hypothetical protein
VQTLLPSVQVVGREVTTPSGPTEPPPEQIPPWDLHSRGAGQSADEAQARGTARHVPVSLVCGGGGVAHDASPRQGGLVDVIQAFSHSKSAGQSAVLVHTIGVASQVPVLGTGIASPASTGAVLVAAPPSAGAVGMSGIGTGAIEVEVPVVPPIPLEPPFVGARPHW